MTMTLNDLFEGKFDLLPSEEDPEFKKQTYTLTQELMEHIRSTPNDGYSPEQLTNIVEFANRVHVILMVLIWGASHEPFRVSEFARRNTPTPLMGALHKGMLLGEKIDANPKGLHEFFNASGTPLKTQIQNRVLKELGFKD